MNRYTLIIHLAEGEIWEAIVEGDDMAHALRKFFARTVCQGAVFQSMRIMDRGPVSV